MDVNELNTRKDHHVDSSCDELAHLLMLRPPVLAILVTEVAERFAYFGFRAVLVLYLHNGLGLSPSAAISLYAAVSCGAYLSPLLGSLLADSRWGRFKTIWRFSTLYAFGLALLTFGAFQLPPAGDDEVDKLVEKKDENLRLAKVATLIGLSMACLGTGGIKPCVSAFGADQIVLAGAERIDDASKHEKQSDDGSSAVGDDYHINDVINQSETSTVEGTKDAEVKSFFSAFYFCINVGALTSFAIVPIIRAHYGFATCFFVTWIVFSSALLIFLGQTADYKHRIHDASQPELSRVLRLCVQTMVSRMRHGEEHGRHMPVPSQEESSDDKGMVEEVQDGDRIVYEDAQKVLHLMPLMLFFPFYWTLYDQQGSVWTLQATHLKLHGLQPEQLQFLNPFEIMVFIPLFDQVIYPWLERLGVNIQPLKKIEYGMCLTVVSFFACAMLEYFIQNQAPNSVSLAWQIPQITIITVGEIFLNVTGLEFAYSQAPGNMQALILALYLLMTAVGDGLSALLFATVFGKLNAAVTMIICAVGMTVNMLLFRRVANRWRPYDGDNRVFEESGVDGIQLGLINRGVIS
jgi:dipeptide/tripeptide permease